MILNIFCVWLNLISLTIGIIAIILASMSIVSINNITCHSDIECNDNNNCSRDFCNDGICEYFLRENSTCFNNDQCDFGFGCDLINCNCYDLCENITCSNAQCELSNCINGQCTEPTLIEGCCRNSSDCEDFDICTTELCIDGFCISTIELPNECSTTTSCMGPNENCINCMCIDLCDGVICNSPPCHFSTCQTGICTEPKFIIGCNQTISGCTNSSECNDGNICTTNICNGGFCEYILEPPNNCSTNSDCSGANMECINCICTDLCENVTCLVGPGEYSFCQFGTCTEPIFIEDSLQCTNITTCDDNDPCTTDFCIEGYCYNILEPPNECSLTQSCTITNYICSNDCQCIDSCEGVICDVSTCEYSFCLGGNCTIPTLVPGCNVDVNNTFIPQCSMNNQCDDDDPCTLDICDNGICENPIPPSSECTMLKSCIGSNMICNGSCQCEDLCQNVTCPVGNCEWSLCIDGLCTDPVLIQGCSQCLNDTQCNDNDPCTLDLCMDGFCQNPLAPTSNCSLSQSCDGLNEQCLSCQCIDLCQDVMCTNTPCETKECINGECVVIDVVPGCCTMNSECPISNECRTGVCTFDNKCEQVLAPGSECAYDGDCLNGQICFFCTCETLASVNCMTSSDCDDSNVCTLDICDGSLQCIYSPLPNCCTSNLQCLNSNPCYVNETCNLSNGVCFFDIKDEDQDDVLCNIDCDDLNNTIGISSTWYRDFDMDGDGNINIRQVSCERPIGFVDNPNDCNDNNPLIFNGATVCNLTLLNEYLLITPLNNLIFEQQFDLSNMQNFGESVASYENIVIIGAPNFIFNNSGFLHYGSVFIYLRDGNLLNLVDIIFSPENTTITNGLFGYTLDVYNDTIVVGAIDEGSNNQGLVHIFIRNSINDQSWNWVQTLQSTTTIFANNFGSGVSINQNLTIAITDNINLEDDAIGALYIFIKLPNENEWIESIKINPTTSNSNTDFGLKNVGINDDGTLIVVGSPINNRAYIFEHSDFNMASEIQVLQPSDTTNNILFGKSVAIDDDGKRIVVGAPSSDFNTSTSSITNSGAVYLFFTNDTLLQNWVEIQKITNNVPGTDDECGTCVSIRNNSIVMGCPFSTSLTSQKIGVVNYYEESTLQTLPFDGNPARFDLAGRLIPLDQNPSTFINFGSSCDVYGHELIIGAPSMSFSGFTLIGGAYSVFCQPQIICPVGGI